MFNIGELVIEKIQSYELWADVPRYEKLDIIHCLLCLIPNPYDSIRKYLKRRKEHNKRYKEFWSNADKVTFNDDRSMYRAALMTKLADEQRGDKLDNRTEYKLRKCCCGGEVELFPSKPWSQDPEIHCKKCGGTWRYGTYSNYLTVKEWNGE